jgi:hypothetical protein
MKRSVYFVLILWLAEFLHGEMAHAQEQSTKVDLAAGEAVESLKELSAQTGLQLFYPSDSLAGVKTKAIRGNFLPSNVLEQLLENTPFIAVQDGATGAFAIVSRKADGSREQFDDKLNNQSSQTKENPDMNRKTDENTNLLKSFLKGVLGLAILGSGTLAIAQEDADVYELTPFEISSSEETGYLATSTLAGTRLRMNLDDVGSSISVFTEQLMDDLGAVDNETLLAYGLNTEVGGTRGNFINPNT